MVVWVEKKRWSENWKEVEVIKGGGQGVTRKVAPAQDGQGLFFQKELLPKLNKSARARQRFYREAQAYDGFRHDRIPKLIESNAQIAVEKWSWEPYFITEIIIGETLEQYIDKRGSVALDEALALAHGLLEVLAYLHSEGCIHRDIKPRNIILRHSKVSDPVLVDFGISFHAESSDDLTMIGEELGNRFFRLPELSGQSTLKKDERSDIAFVGAILFYAITGVVPGVPEDESSRLPHQRGTTPQLIFNRAGAKTSVLMSFFDRALANDINARFLNAAQMIAELVRIRDMEMKVDEEESIENLEAQIAERISNSRNKKLAGDMQATQNAVNRVTTLAAEVVSKNGGGIYWTINGGSTTSNTSNQINFGYYHSGDQSRQFLPQVKAVISGSELVVSINSDEVLRVDATNPTYDAEFENRVRTIYLRGLKKLADGE